MSFFLPFPFLLLTSQKIRDSIKLQLCTGIGSVSFMSITSSFLKLYNISFQAYKGHSICLCFSGWWDSNTEPQKTLWLLFMCLPLSFSCHSLFLSSFCLSLKCCHFISSFNFFLPIIVVVLGLVPVGPPNDQRRLWLLPTNNMVFDSVCSLLSHLRSPSDKTLVRSELYWGPLLSMQGAQALFSGVLLPSFLT